MLAGTPWRSAIGKMLLAGGAVTELLLAGAPWRSAIGKLLLAGALRPEDVTEETVARFLYTAGLPDVDLLIRTSGEMRLSNFLLYQCAYAEFEFPTVLWPDFDREELHRALASYQKRSRRFGGVK